jgi:hypothetical protein
MLLAWQRSYANATHAGHPWQSSQVRGKHRWHATTTLGHDVTDALLQGVGVNAAQGSLSHRSAGAQHVVGSCHYPLLPHARLLPAGPLCTCSVDDECLPGDKDGRARTAILQAVRLWRRYVNGPSFASHRASLQVAKHATYRG